MSSLGIKGKSFPWILDSGATDHVTCCFTYFYKVRSVSGIYVSLPDNSIVQVTHIGTIQLTSYLFLHDVLYVPQFTYNLVSVSKLMSHTNCCVTFKHDLCEIQALPQGMMIGQAKHISGLYHIVLPPVIASAMGLVDVKSNLWNSRLGHLSEKSLKLISSRDASMCNDH